MVSVNTLLLEETIRHQVELQRYEAGVVARMIAVLDRADKRIAAELAVALQEIDPSLFKMERLESLLTSIRELSKAAYEQIGEDMREELKEFNAYELSYQHQALVTHLPAVVHVASVSANQVYTAAMARPFQGVLLKDVWKDLDAQAMKRLRQTIANGFVEGKTTDQIIREVRGTRANNFKDGIVEKSRRDIEAVVRTAIANVAGVAQDNMMAANADLLKAVQWSSTLDTLTSQICRPRDGKLYTPVDHKPIGHKFPWLQGPGRLHWRAIAKGTPILTRRGWSPIELVVPGDEVLTHRGRFRPVLEQRSKLNEAGVIRAIHTESGMVLRATDDHPVFVAGGWKFAGDIEVGEKLFRNPNGSGEVGGARGVVMPESDNRPSSIDEINVASQRTLNLIASAIGLKGEHEIRPCEIDDVCSEWVLRNPSVIEGDESLQHHFLAACHLLEKNGCKALRKALSSLSRHDVSRHPFRGFEKRASLDIGSPSLLGNSVHEHGVVVGHPFGVSSMDGASLLGHSPRPVPFTGSALNSSSFEANSELLGLSSDGDAVLLGVIGEAAIGEGELSLNAPERLTLFDVMKLDEAEMIGLGFAHDEVIALELQEYESYVYDLEVQEDSSYFASGVVVSNCRSGRTPVLKSHKELGIDVPEIVVDGKTRASMDGQVAAETTYADWMKKQSAARQDEVLGPTRGRLMREGKLSLDDMYSARGKPLTLDELRKKDAEAFKLAGL